MDYLRLLDTLLDGLATLSPTGAWRLYEGGAPLDQTAPGTDIQAVTREGGKVKFRYHNRQPDDLPCLLVTHVSDQAPAPGSSSNNRTMALEWTLMVLTSRERDEVIVEYERLKRAGDDLLKYLRRPTVAGNAAFAVVSPEIIYIRLTSTGQEDLCGCQMVFRLQCTTPLPR